MSQSQFDTQQAQETIETHQLGNSQELYRLIKEYVYTPTSNKKYRYRRVTISIWSDLTIMKRQQTLLHTDEPTQQPHESGWSVEVYVEVKARGITPASVRDHFMSSGGYQHEEKQHEQA